MANRSFGLERNLKTIHGWLGVLILPWVVIIGATGLYLNHKDLVKSVLPNSHKVDLAVIDKWPDPQAVSMETADRIARDVWPSAIREPVVETRFRSQPVYKVRSDRGSVYVVRAIGHYWVQSGLWREFFDPAGNRLNRYFKWTGLFKRLHTD